MKLYIYIYIFVKETKINYCSEQTQQTAPYGSIQNTVYTRYI